MVFWGLFCSGLVAALSVWNAVSPLPLAFWSRFWKIAGIGIPACIALVTAVWFTWGGLRNLRDLFARLRVQKINHLDDGTVVGHRNLDEAAPSETASEKK
jgi:SSS family solute:Na+ symporter